MTDHSPKIDIHYFDPEIKFSDVLVIVTHPTIGTISSICGNYLIEHLNLRLIGTFLSPELSPTTIIRNGTPEPPIRIYAGEYIEDDSTIFDQIVIISSELPLSAPLMYELSDRIIEWSKFNNARAILTIEAINKEEVDFKIPNVFSLTTNNDAKSIIKDLNLNAFENGMISGFTGLLQYKGFIENYPVISILSEAHKDFPDSKSAAAVLSKLNSLLPTIEIDFEPLLKQAELFEKQLKLAMTQIDKNGTSNRNSSSGMFA